MQVVIRNYGVDKFDVPLLKAQFLHLPEVGKFYGLDHRTQLSGVISLFQKLDPGKKMLIEEVLRLAKFILVIPATNAVSKRSLSSLKRIKTYLRSTTPNN